MSSWVLKWWSLVNCARSILAKGWYICSQMESCKCFSNSSMEINFEDTFHSWKECYSNPFYEFSTLRFIKALGMRESWEDLMVVAECGCNSSVVIIKLVAARTGKSVVIEPITQRVSDSLISRGHRLLIQPWSPRPARPLKIRDECCAGRVLGFFLICSTFTPIQDHQLLYQLILEFWSAQ